MPEDKNPKRMPKPRKKLLSTEIVSSLKIIVSLFALLRDTSNTKNHAAKDVPIIRRMAARCG